jgi:hypothetical protein
MKYVLLVISNEIADGIKKNSIINMKHHHFPTELPTFISAILWENDDVSY